MKHLFVPYELALKLKEKGFEEKCLGYYLGQRQNPNENDFILEENQCNKEHPDWVSTISAPLYQQVVDWVREKHGIHLEVSRRSVNNSYIEYNPYVYDKFQDRHTEGTLGDEYHNYYEALTGAIVEALKLI